MALVTEMTSPIRIRDLTRSLLCDDCGVMLKESPGKGMGVFTTKAFKKDAFVTVYPSHMVGVPLDSERVAWMTSRDCTWEHADKLAKEYAQKIMDGFIAGDPALLEGGLGHMVNDGAR